MADKTLNNPEHGGDVTGAAGFPWPELDGEVVFGFNPSKIESVATAINRADLPSQDQLRRLFIAQMDAAMETMEASVIQVRSGDSTVLDNPKDRPSEPLLRIKWQLARAAIVGHCTRWPDNQAAIDRLLHECTVASERGWRFVYETWPELRSTLSSNPTKPRRHGGRPTPPDSDVQADRKMAKKWIENRDSSYSVTKEEFCIDEGTTPQELDKLLDRIRMRKKRNTSEK